MITGFNPSWNQSEAGTPNDSECGPVYRGAGVALARGFQTYLPGPFHFEDQVGVVGGSPYYPPPVVQMNTNFDGDVSLRQSPVITLPTPWQRRAP